MSSFLGACGYCLCKLFRVSTALDFFIVVTPRFVFVYPRSGAQQRSLSERLGLLWQGTRRPSEKPRQNLV